MPVARSLPPVNAPPAPLPPPSIALVAPKASTPWPAPAIFDWQTFLRTAAQDQSNSDARLLLNPLQEQSLWAAIAGSDTHLATLLEGPRNRMAHLAMQAHSLLCSYAPDYLCTSARAAWQADAENFSTWLAAFDETCRAAKLLSPARLPLELIPRLEANPAARPPLLLAGFDRILTTQRRLFDAWGAWQQASLAAPSSISASTPPLTRNPSWPPARSGRDRN